MHDELSTDALRILRQINTRGLTVLWSYRVPEPRYDDGERMAEDDWRIVDRELFRIETRYTVFQQEAERHEITRTFIQNGIKFTQAFVRYPPDETEYPLPMTNIETGYSDTPDQMLSETLVVHNGMGTYSHRVRVSDYLDETDIRQDDWTEEHVGMLQRLTLTERALRLIG